ncbi:MAG TPA: chromate transporter, partial [Opitutaceae bacterium]|nr:chromate transporter [Opitutaceae bacterium]
MQTASGKAAATAHPPRTSLLELFAVALRLGLTSFGGPIAHLGYFRREYVERRRWLDEAGFADLVALCQFLPGPASSQFGFALGYQRGGLAGALAAWIGFTLPSAVLMLSFAAGFGANAELGNAGWLHGLKVAAVAVVAQAVWQMARSLCPDWPRALLAVGAAAALLLFSAAWVQIAVIVAG